MQHISFAVRLNRLLEEATVEDSLATELLGQELLLDLLTVLLLGDIHLDPGVVLRVGVLLLHLSDDLRTTEHPSTRDKERRGLLIGVTGDVHDTQSVLAAGIRTLDEATDGVTSHVEDLVVRVVVVHAGEPRVTSGIELGPELLEEISEERLLRPGELLDGIKDHGRGSESIKRVGLLGLRLILIIEEIAHVLLGSRLRSLLLLLLGGGLGLLSGRGLTTLGGLGLLLSEGDSAEDAGKLRLVDAGGEPTSHVTEGSEELGGKDELVEIDEGDGEGDISEGDVVADEVSVVEEVVVQHSESVGQLLLGLSLSLGVELEITEDGVNPDAAGGLDLVGGELDPLVDLTQLEVVVTEEVGISAEASDITSDGVALEDGTVGGLKDRDLTQGVHLEEALGLVVLAHLEGGDIDLDLVVLSGDQGLLSAVVLRISIKLKCRHVD